MAWALRTFYCSDFDVFSRQETGMLTAENIAKLVGETHGLADSLVYITMGMPIYPIFHGTCFDEIT